MSNTMPPVPYQTPVADDKGLASSIWADWFRQALVRLGGGTLASKSDSAAGFQTIPGGLVIQWGATASLGSATTTAITFPQAFPSSCMQVIAGVRDNGSGLTTETGHFGTGVYSKTGFSLFNRTSAAYVFNWVAIGF